MAVDASGQPAGTSPVKVKLVPAGAGHAVDLEPDRAWLADPARAYPIRIDPTFMAGKDPAISPGTVTLRPNATVVAQNRELSGAATHHGAVSDGSDSSYSLGSSGGCEEGSSWNCWPGGGDLIFGLADPDIGNAIVDHVQVVVRWSGNAQVFVYQRLGGVDSSADTRYGDPWGTIFEFAGTARPTKPGGGPWDQTALNALQVKINVSGGDGSVWQIREVWVKVSYTPFNPGGDAFVSSTDPNQTYNGTLQYDGTRYIDKIGHAGGAEYQAFAKYGTNDIFGKRILAATWHGVFYSASPTPAAVSISPVAGPWSATTVTWATKPSQKSSQSPRTTESRPANCWS